MLDKLTKDLIARCIYELKKDENVEILENEIVSPVLTRFTNKIYPYVALFFFMYSLVLIIVILILVLILMKKAPTN